MDESRHELHDSKSPPLWSKNNESYLSRGVEQLSCESDLTNGWVISRTPSLEYHHLYHLLKMPNLISLEGANSCYINEFWQMNESCHTCSEAKKRMDWYAEVKPASLVRYVYTPANCSVLWCVAVCCSVWIWCRGETSFLRQVRLNTYVLQCVSVCCSVLQCVASVHLCGAHAYIYTSHVCSKLKSPYSVLQHVAARCSVLQCVVVCCSVQIRRQFT